MNQPLIVEDLLKRDLEQATNSFRELDRALNGEAAREMFPVFFRKGLLAIDPLKPDTSQLQREIAQTIRQVKPCK